MTPAPISASRFARVLHLFLTSLVAAGVAAQAEEHQDRPRMVLYAILGAAAVVLAIWELLPRRRL